MSELETEWKKQAQQHIENGNLQEAINLYETTSSATSSPDATLLSDLGYLYHQVGQLKKAVAAYGRSLQQYPESATTLLLRGSAFLEQKRYQAALKDFNEAIRLSPYLDNAYWGRGQVFMALNDYSWAVASFTKAIDLNPDEPDYYESRAKGYKALGQIPKEKEDLAKWEALKTG